MTQTPVVGSIVFSSVSNPNTWDIGETKRLVFSSPSEAKRGEELFTKMQNALDAKDARIRELEWATGYAKRLAIALHAKHYPEVTQWEPFDDLSGILSQIDNMASGLVRAREALK